LNGQLRFAHELRVETARVRVAHDESQAFSIALFDARLVRIRPPNEGLASAVAPLHREDNMWFRTVAVFPGAVSATRRTAAHAASTALSSPSRWVARLVGTSRSDVAM
jgi:hypothetical protein